ncbi:hypothetical protein GQ55_2G169300 [Panicum hallii var. hallii]|uniref:Uncharacterized protein n=1 Tax=Panicum hallii var. hallii TaxID=1504633 RepID=A0A2T7EQ29_9POAL|nr:hypothetical protein GQ55_2G169300 [Panicum hallii var. hallii]
MNQHPPAPHSACPRRRSERPCPLPPLPYRLHQLRPPAAAVHIRTPARQPALHGSASRPTAGPGTSAAIPTARRRGLSSKLRGPNHPQATTAVPATSAARHRRE